MWGEEEPKASLLYQCHKTFIFAGISGPILFPGKNFSFPFPTPGRILATLSSPCLGYPRMFPLQGPEGSEGIYGLVRGEEAVVPRRHHVVMFEMTACCQKSFWKEWDTSFGQLGSLVQAKRPGVVGSI